MHFEPAHLHALAAILRHGSFEAASHALGVSAPAVSLRIRALEDQMGGPVVTRTSPPEPTQLGARLAQHAQQIALLEAELSRDLGQASRGAVRIAVNADSLDTWFLPALAGLDLQVELVVDDQTKSIEWLRRGEVSAALTDQAKPIQGCDVIPLGALLYRATASPGFVQTWFAEGVTADTLMHAPMLQYSSKDRLQHDWAARLCGRTITPPTTILPSTKGFVEACRLGIGWGLNPAPLITDALSNGTLACLAPQTTETPLFWQVSRVVAGPLKPLTAAVKRAAKAALEQGDPQISAPHISG